MTVPAGALATTVDVAIARDSTGAPDLPATGIDTAGAPFALTPHGTAFAVPATVRVPFHADRIPTDATPALYKAEPGGAFAPIPTTIDNGMLVADVSNFSWVLPGYASTRPRMVYVLTSKTSIGISSFRIDKSTGALGGPTSTAAVGPTPLSIAVHPSRRFLLVTNGNGTAANGVAAYSLSVYKLDVATGQVGALLSTAETTDPAARADPIEVVVHPTGKFLYVVNHDRFSGNPNTNIAVFPFDAVTGTLGARTTSADSGGAPPTAITFHPGGDFAYVPYIFRVNTPVGNTFHSRVKTYSVDRATGALSGPIGDQPAGDTPWAMVVDRTGKFAYVAAMGSDEVRRYTINQTTGILTYQSSVQVQSKPSTLSIDSTSRFLYVGKQTPFFNVNLTSFQINASDGSLGGGNSVLLGTGSQVGPIGVVAEPQGNFTYALNGDSGLVAFKVGAGGSLTPTGAPVSNIIVPGGGIGVGEPFLFAASGTSPVWEDGCSQLTTWEQQFGLPPQGCFTPMTMVSTGGGGGGGGTGGATPPSPAANHALDVTIGTWGGSILSSPAGIDYSTVDLSRNRFSANFATGSSVQLCATTPAGNSGTAYDLEWFGNGGCSGTALCTTVKMNGDVACRAEFTPR